MYIASDAAVGYGDGYRQLMEEGKWWEYEDFFIGESGSDFALSRIRSAFEAENKLPTPEMLAACVHKVAKEMAGKDHVDYVEAEMLWAAPDQIAIVGGDGGVIRRKDWGVVGHGYTPLLAYLTDRMPPVSKRTLRRISNLSRAGMTYTARMCESVCDPFFEDTIEP